MDKLLTGVVGALVGLIAVAVGAWLQARRERGNWLRDQKLRAAVEYTAAMRYLLNQYRTAGAAGMDQVDRREWRHKMQAGRAGLHLLCAPATTAVVDDLASALHGTHPDEEPEFTEQTEALFKEVSLAIRDELSHR